MARRLRTAALAMSVGVAAAWPTAGHAHPPHVWITVQARLGWLAGGDSARMLAAVESLDATLVAGFGLAMLAAVA